MTEIAFAGLPILTAPGRVMTPRDASEQLVAAACAWVGSGPARICDVGTGSGAIAIAIARECPETVVWAGRTRAAAPSLSPGRTSGGTGSRGVSSWNTATCSTPSRGSST